MHYIKQALSWNSNQSKQIKQRISLIIVLTLGSILFPFGGVLAGLNRDWFSMVFFFCIFAFIVDHVVLFTLNLIIDTCFKQMENAISKKSDSFWFENQPIYRKFGFFIVVYSGVLLSLAILAGTRQRWLMLCVILVVFTITTFITTGLMLALRIKAYSKRLEELICQTRGKA